jgi:hypothetical protein
MINTETHEEHKTNATEFHNDKIQSDKFANYI